MWIHVLGDTTPRWLVVINISLLAPAMDWWTLKSSSQAPPKHPLPKYLLTQHHIPAHFKSSIATMETSFMTYTNKPWADHYRSHKTDIRWKLFTASEATPSLDLNITHNTAHMTGAAVAQQHTNWATGWQSKVQIPVGERFFFPPQHPDQLWGQPAPNGYQGSFLGEKRLMS